MLSLRENRLEGPATPITQCRNLELLDLRHNSFTGPLPATKVGPCCATGAARSAVPRGLGPQRWPRHSAAPSCNRANTVPRAPPQYWERLVSMRVGHNNFTGTIPYELFKAQTISYLDISNNRWAQLEVSAWHTPLRHMRTRLCGGLDACSDHQTRARPSRRLTGSLPFAVSVLVYLTDIDASSNMLTGAVDDLFYIGKPSRPPLRGSLGRPRLPAPGGSAFARRQRHGASAPRLHFTHPTPAPIRTAPQPAWSASTWQTTTSTAPSRDARSRAAMHPSGARRAGPRAGHCAAAGARLHAGSPNYPYARMACSNAAPTTPTCHRLAYNLKELNYVNNTRLAGRFPDAAALLTQLVRVGLDGTALSCVPDKVVLAQERAREKGERVQPYRCPAGKQLPCFLRQLDYDVPRQDKSNMACKWVAGRRGAGSAGLQIGCMLAAKAAPPCRPTKLVRARARRSPPPRAEPSSGATPPASASTASRPCSPWTRSWSLTRELGPRAKRRLVAGH